MLLPHWIRLAASRAACTAGSNRAISTAMIAMTTRSSISVNLRIPRILDIKAPSPGPLDDFWNIIGRIIAYYATIVSKDLP